MLGVFNIFKYYNHNPVLCDVSFNIDNNTRAGLVGANGCGKTTLLKIISGLETADSGQISYSHSLVSGYLPQTIIENSRMTIDTFLLSGVSDGRPKENDNDIDHNLYEVLYGLGISYLERSRKIETLSGGEKTRISLAAVLLKTPDLLLLDEPTNNLDLQSLEWLEKYLCRFKGGMIIASHDRAFLNNVVGVIFEIDEHSHKLVKFVGKYDAYKSAKENEKRQREADYRQQQEEIKELKRLLRQTAHDSTHHRKFTKDNEKFAKEYKEGRRERAASHVIRAAAESLRRIQENPIQKPPKPLRFKPDVSLADIRSAEVIIATGISKEYNGQMVLRNIYFTLSHQSRVLITGANGAGKTTLLRILTGNEPPDEGSVKTIPSARIGYLPQEPAIRDTNTDPVSYWLRHYPGNENDAVYHLVTCGLFRYDELNKKVNELSLGQIRKLEIAGLIAGEPDVLVLDEPTNHLSLDVLESFEAAIKEFQGPVLAVSHDRRFMQQFGGEIWELNDGNLKLSWRISLT